MRIETRQLVEKDLELVGDPLRRFFREYNLTEDLYRRLVDETFTVISIADQKSERGIGLQPEEG
jgi:hypothetical protein